MRAAALAESRLLIRAVAEWYEPLEIWREWAEDVRGGPIDAGHFFPEEAPDETARPFARRVGRMRYWARVSNSMLWPSASSK
jgi:hypothetical protein